MKNYPLVAIIVLCFNNSSDTIECIETIQKSDYPNLLTIAVDNGSTDDTVNIITRLFPQISIVKNNRNLGYAEGNNVGVEYALSLDPEYIFVLNNDTTLAVNCISLLVSDLSENESAAAAAPLSYFYDNPKMIYFMGGWISSFGTVHHIGMGQTIKQESRHSYNTQWLSGCAILFRSEALRKVGLFDSRYFLLFEDTDWSLRSKKAGYSLRLVSNAHLWHKVSRTLGSLRSPFYIYFYTRNVCLWIEKNIPLSKKPISYIYNLKPIFSIVLYELKIDKTYRKIKIFKAFFIGLFDYIFRRFGFRGYSW